MITDPPTEDVDGQGECPSPESPPVILCILEDYRLVLPQPPTLPLVLIVDTKPIAFFAVVSARQDFEQ